MTFSMASDDIHPRTPDADSGIATETAPQGVARAARRDQPPEIAGYEIIRELHRGGQGVVYEALQRSAKRKVAIKVMLAGPFSSKAARKRFEREIELVAQLKHPNIIPVFHSGEANEGLPFFVMEYVRGTRLDHFIRDKKPPLEEVLALFAKVCKAVQYAHQRGVIHRDLKPSNIIVDFEGTPRVLDFGLAKLLAGPVQTVVSVSAEILGTIPYMSPEQVRGNPDEIDTRSDVYALGVVLYELLTGRLPYPTSGQMAELIRHIAETPPSRPTATWTMEYGITERTRKRSRPGHCPIDGEVETITMKALAKDRERRYQSAGELARDLDLYVAGEAIEAKRDTLWYLARILVRKHRYRTIIYSSLLSLILAVTAFLFVSWRFFDALYIQAPLPPKGVHLADLAWSAYVTRDDRAIDLGNAVLGLSLRDFRYPSYAGLIDRYAEDRMTSLKCSTAYLVGVSEFRRGNLPQAQQAFESAELLGSRQARVWLGRTHLRLGNTNTAIAMLQTEEGFCAKYYLCRALESAGRLDEAVACYRARFTDYEPFQLHALEEPHEREIPPRLSYRVAQIYIKKGDFQSAVDTAEAVALALDRERADVAFLLAVAYSRLGRSLDAHASYDRGLEGALALREHDVEIDAHWIEAHEALSSVAFGLSDWLRDPKSATPDDQAIRELIHSISVSDGAIIQSQYSPAEAAEYLQRKWYSMRGLVRNVDDFLRLVPRPVEGGEPFLIRYPDGQQELITNFFEARRRETKSDRSE